MRFNFRGILRLAVLLSVVNIAVITGGCESRPAAAQKLFAQGKYQEVADKFADLEIGRRARAKLAAEVMAKGDYEAVLKDYPDTPAAYQARVAKADKLFADGKYTEVVKDYINTDAGVKALDLIADSMVAAGNANAFFTLYGETDRGKEIKNDLAKVAFDSVMALKGEAKIKGLEYVNSTFMATTIYKNSVKELESIRNPNKTKPGMPVKVPAKTPAAPK